MLTRISYNTLLRYSLGYSLMMLSTILSYGTPLWYPPMVFFSDALLGCPSMLLWHSLIVLFHVTLPWWGSCRMPSCASPVCGPLPTIHRLPWWVSHRWPPGALLAILVLIFGHYVRRTQTVLAFEQWLNSGWTCILRVLLAFFEFSSYSPNILRVRTSIFGNRYRANATLSNLSRQAILASEMSLNLF